MSDVTPWERAYGFVRSAEGGISEDKKDRGNYYTYKGKKYFVPTRYGLTFGNWVNSRKPKSQKDFEAKLKQFESVDKNDVRDHFKKIYWDKYQLGKIKDPTTATQILDAMVNQNWKLGGKQTNITRALGIKDQPSLDKTIEAINAKIDAEGTDVINNKIALERVNKYKKSKTWKTHKKGWIRHRVAPFISEDAAKKVAESTGINLDGTRRFIADVKIPPKGEKGKVPGIDETKKKTIKEKDAVPKITSLHTPGNIDRIMNKIDFSASTIKGRQYDRMERYISEHLRSNGEVLNPTTVEEQVAKAAIDNTKEEELEKVEYTQEDPEAILPEEVTQELAGSTGSSGSTPNADADASTTNEQAEGGYQPNGRVTQFTRPEDIKAQGNTYEPLNIF